MQSLLSAICTVHNETSVINSMEDIIKLNFTVIGLPNFKQIIWQNTIRKSFRGERNLTLCIDHILNSNRSVCKYSHRMIIHFMSENPNVRIPKTDIFERKASYIVAKNFPLLRKFNMILSIMNQASLIELFRTRDKYDALKFHRNYTGTQNIKAENYATYFSILISGWILGFDVFVLEVISFIKNYPIPRINLNRFSVLITNYLRSIFIKN